jgi:hypothetical protein
MGGVLEVDVHDRVFFRIRTRESVARKLSRLEDSRQLSTDVASTVERVRDDGKQIHDQTHD